MSLLFNMLSRFVIAFLPRSKYFLISWPQSPSAVILEPKKIKSATASFFPQFPHFPFFFSPEQECGETKDELKSRGFEMVMGGHPERCIWAEIKKARGRKYWYYEELRKQCSWQRKPQVQRPWGEPGEDQCGENGRGRGPDHWGPGPPGFKFLL